jgi:DNA-binding NarL/FixJ family response regulator
MKTLTQTIRVILADDHTLVRAGIRALLEKLPDVQVVGEAGNGRDVLELAKTERPDVVLMDIAMPGLNGLESTARIIQESPGARVIVLSMHHHEEYIARALKAGASGYLLKKAATAELHSALQHVMQGELYISKEISDRVARRFSAANGEASNSPLEQLTRRQREILQLIAEGQNTKQIADILKVSPKTVEYHRVKLMNCLNVHDIPGLVRFALRTGLIPHEAPLENIEH